MRATRTCCCRVSTCRRCFPTPRRRSSPIAAAKFASARRCAALSRVDGGVDDRVGLHRASASTRRSSRSVRISLSACCSQANGTARCRGAGSGRGVRLRAHHHRLPAIPGAALPLASPMLKLDGAPGQWLFDRGLLDGPTGLAAVVISTEAPGAKIRARDAGARDRRPVARDHAAGCSAPTVDASHRRTPRDLRLHPGPARPAPDCCLRPPLSRRRLHRRRTARQRWKRRRAAASRRRARCSRRSVTAPRADHASGQASAASAPVPSARCISTTSSQRSNFQPTLAATPARENPAAACRRIERRIRRVADDRDHLARAARSHAARSARRAARARCPGRRNRRARRPNPRR